VAGRPAGLVTRAVELLGWAVTACAGLLALTQAFGIGGLPVLYVLQALTPVLLLPAVPLAVAAAATGRLGLAATNALVATALVVLVAPAVIAVDAPVPPPGTPSLRVAHSNVYYRSREPDAAAATLLGMDADVLAVTEYTPRLAAALAARGAAAAYPHRVEVPSWDASGVALHSRHPIVEVISTSIGTRPGLDVVIDADGTRVHVLVVHPVPATRRRTMQRWAADLAEIGRVALARDLPVLLVGDFNAARWHPEFRRLLRRGFRDAHESLGRGLARSWPLGRRIPPFVRIDHALVSGAVLPVRIADVVVPGSDHVAFVVDVALSPPSVA